MSESERKQVSSRLPVESTAFFIAQIAVLSSLVAFLKILTIPMPIPLGSIDASSVLIFAIAILYGPSFATPVICIGQFVGLLYLTALLGFPAVFIPGIVAVRGAEAFIVGKLRHKNGNSGKWEIFAMVIGVLWETGAFVLADTYLFGPGFGVIVAFTIIDAIWIIPAIGVIAALRRIFEAKYFDDYFGFADNEQLKKKLLYPSLAAIIISWILIILAPLAGILL